MSTLDLGRHDGDRAVERRQGGVGVAGPHKEFGASGVEQVWLWHSVEVDAGHR